MTRKKLRDEVLNLPAADRARLARDIIASLDGPSEEGVEEAWVQEIERRAREVSDGTVQLVDWSEVRRRLRARLSAGSS